MKYLIPISFVLSSCALQTGTIYKKTYEREVIYNYCAYSRKEGISEMKRDVPFGKSHIECVVRFTNRYGGYKIHYKDKDKAGECQVSRTIYNIMNEGDYFDCSALGIDAVL